MDCFTNYETQMHKNIFVNSKDQRNLLQMKYKSQQTTSTISVCIEIVKCLYTLIGMFLLLKVPITIPQGYDYKMRVKVSGGLSFDKTVTRIQATRKASSIFIQTDKAIYKPGDLGTFLNMKI